MQGNKYFGYVVGIFLLVALILFFFQFKFEKVRWAFHYFLLSLILNVSQLVVNYLILFIGHEYEDEFSFSIYSFYYVVTISYIGFVDNNFIRVFLVIIQNIIIFIVALTSLEKINYRQILNLTSENFKCSKQ